MTSGGRAEGKSGSSVSPNTAPSAGESGREHRLDGPAASTTTEWAIRRLVGDLLRSMRRPR